MVTPKVLRIDGILGQADTFTGAVRLTAAKRGAPPFFLVEDDLKSPGAAMREIDADRVDVTNVEVELRKGRIA